MHALPKLLMSHSGPSQRHSLPHLNTLVLPLPLGPVTSSEPAVPACTSKLRLRASSLPTGVTTSTSLCSSQWAAGQQRASGRKGPCYRCLARSCKQGPCLARHARGSSIQANAPRTTLRPSLAPEPDALGCLAVLAGALTSRCRGGRVQPRRLVNHLQCLADASDATCRWQSAARTNCDVSAGNTFQAFLGGLNMSQGIFLPLCVPQLLSAPTTHH